MSLKIEEQYDYTKHSLAKKGFYRRYIDEKGNEVEDTEYNEHCKKFQNLDLSKIYAEEVKEPEPVSFLEKVKKFILGKF